MKTYKKTPERHAQLLEAACLMAEEGHFADIRRHHLSAACSTSDGNVSRVLGDMEQMRASLITYAIENDRHTVIAQAIIAKHPATDDLSREERLAILTIAA